MLMALLMTSFKVLEGLKQGNLLAPYLFFIAMKTLSCLLKGLGFKVGGRDSDGLEVSHLLFANDTLIFFKACKNQVLYLS